MAVRIRLRRTGRKNLPSYRIGVFDGRTRRDGPAIEIVGWFNPLMREAGKGFKVQADRIEEWVRRGAKMTMAVTELLDRQGVKLAARPVKAAPVKKAAKAPAGKDAPKSGALKRKADPGAVARKKRKLAKRESRRAWKAKKLAAAAAKTAAAAASAPAAGA